MHSYDRLHFDDLEPNILSKNVTEEQLYDNDYFLQKYQLFSLTLTQGQSRQEPGTRDRLREDLLENPKSRRKFEDESLPPDCIVLLSAVSGKKLDLGLISTKKDWVPSCGGVA
jgi:hypothetical protein